jgi:hypothetical protein
LYQCCNKVDFGAQNNNQVEKPCVTNTFSSSDSLQFSTLNHSQNNNDLAQSLTESCSEGCKNELREDHPDKLISLYRLAELHYSQGKYEILFINNEASRYLPVLNRTN